MWWQDMHTPTLPRQPPGLGMLAQGIRTLIPRRQPPEAAAAGSAACAAAGTQSWAFAAVAHSRSLLQAHRDLRSQLTACSVYCAEHQALYYCYDPVLPDTDCAVSKLPQNNTYL